MLDIIFNTWWWQHHAVRMFFFSLSKTGKLLKDDGKIDGTKCMTILEENLLEIARNLRLG